jgi:hypothetical protein
MSQLNIFLEMCKSKIPIIDIYDEEMSAEIDEHTFCDGGGGKDNCEDCPAYIKCFAWDEGEWPKITTAELGKLRITYPEFFI